MKTLSKSLIPLSLIASLGGCANNYGGYGYNDYPYRNAVTGAAVGAAGGALVGYAAGGDSKGALLGGTLGAVAGGAAGYYYDQKDKQQRESNYDNRPYYYDNNYNQSSYAPAKRRRSHQH